MRRLAVAAVFLGACAPELAPEEGGGSGSTTAVASTGADESSSGDAESSGDASGGPMCPALENEPHGTPLRVTVRNGTGSVIYLDSQFPCLSSYMRMADAQGDAIEWRTDGWLISCEELGGEAPVCGGPGCTASAVRLEPDAVYTETWPGFVHEMHMLDSACIGDGADACGDACFVERTAGAGTYQVDVAFARDADCGEQSCADYCEADLGPGACEMLFVDQVLGEREVSSVELTYPDMESVALVIE